MIFYNENNYWLHMRCTLLKYRKGKGILEETEEEKNNRLGKKRLSLNLLFMRYINIAWQDI